jgi:tRNA-Thr(GGU) m(6)t(6)A37 methyltransferase TsaA
MDEYALIPVGYVRNDVRTPDDVPYNGAASVLELLPDCAAAAEGLEPGYVWVLTWLHQSERPTGRPGRGRFASRTPVRPNPVAVTAARLLRVEGARLHVDGLDVCDGTPLLDIKPYVREFDCVFGPADPAWRRAALPEQRLARLVRTVERCCGPLTPLTALAARLALAADRDLDIAANSPDLTWECRCPLAVAAGIQAVSGAPLDSPRLCLLPDEGILRVSTGERSVAYRLQGPAGSPQQVLEAPEASLIERLPA